MQNNKLKYTLITITGIAFVSMAISNSRLARELETLNIKIGQHEDQLQALEKSLKVGALANIISGQLNETDRAPMRKKLEHQEPAYKAQKVVLQNNLHNPPTEEAPRKKVDFDELSNKPETEQMDIIVSELKRRDNFKSDGAPKNPDYIKRLNSILKKISGKK